MNKYINKYTKCVLYKNILIKMFIEIFMKICFKYIKIIESHYICAKLNTAVYVKSRKYIKK